MPTSGSDAFDRFRDVLASDESLRAELERALQLNIDRVNPSDRGNRFIFGGTVEWVLAAAAYAAGVLTVPSGHGTDAFDLVDLAREARGLWSVKTQSGKTPQDFRISNGLGGAGKGLTSSTVFVSPHLPGLVFLDPALHLEALTGIKATGDATILRHASVAEHAALHPACVAPLRIPKNAGTGTEDPLVEYVRSLVTPTHFPRLSRLFREASHEGVSLAEGLVALAELRARGLLTEAEFAQVKEKLLRSD